MFYWMLSALLVGFAGGFGLTIGIVFGVWVTVQVADLCDGMWSSSFSKDARPQ